MDTSFFGGGGHLADTNEGQFHQFLCYFCKKEEDDLPYEEEILRNPYSVKSWLRYIEHKKKAPKNILNMVYERALKELPGRYVIFL